MNKSDFYYDLPEELIAQHPVEPRDSSRLMTVDRISGEIQHKHFYDLLDELKDDDLSEWAKQHKEAFIPLDPTIQANVTSILKMYPTMIQIKSTGNSNGDPFLVATAKVKNGCIITDERPGDVKSKNYRIPNVCSELGIHHINLHEFLDLILE